MKTIKLRDQMGVVRSFQGEIIPGATNDIQREDENGRRPRWVEMQAYRHADGGYVLHRNGRTAPVYHRKVTCGTPDVQPTSSSKFAFVVPLEISEEVTVSESSRKSARRSISVTFSAALLGVLA